MAQVGEEAGGSPAISKYIFQQRGLEILLKRQATESPAHILEQDLPVLNWQAIRDVPVDVDDVREFRRYGDEIR